MILKAEFIDLQEPIFATMESTSQSFKIEGVESYSPPFSDHTKLINRDFPDQHPIDAITGKQEAWYAFSIPDDDEIYKECVAGYSTFVTGNTYISYRDFQYMFSYTTTGELGTDLYITNIRFFDITDLDLSNITRAGIANFTDFVEDTGIASINMNKEFYTNNIIEI